MGSIKPRSIKRSDGSQYQILRAQYHHPHAPGDRPRNYEQTFNADAPKYKTVDGKTQNKRQRERAAENDARAFVNDNEQAIANGTWVDPDAPVEPEPEDDVGPTVAEVVNEWRKRWNDESTRWAIAPKTQASYASILEPAVVKNPTARTKPRELYIVGRWGDRPIADVKAEDVAAWVQELKARYRPQTTHNCYTAARTLFAFAVARKYIEARDLPTGRDTGVDLPKKAEARKEMTFLEPDELDALIDALPDWWKAPVWIDALTGLRAGELWGLTFADVDLKNAELDISKAIKELGTGMLVGPTKTHAARRIDIPEVCLDRFREVLDRPGVYLRGVRGPNARPDSAPIRGYAAIVGGAVGGVEDEQDPRRLIFTTTGRRPGRPVSEGNFLPKLQEAVLTAVERGTLSTAKFIKVRPNPRTGEPEEVSTLRFHDLRHTGATIALDSLGGTQSALLDVSRMLGHASLDTTTRLYGHRTRAGRKRLAEGISAGVKKRPKSPANSGKRSGKI